MGDKYGELLGVFKVFVYFDDYVVCEQVKVVLIGMIVLDFLYVEVVEIVIQVLVVDVVSSGYYDVLIVDGEFVFYGGMGVCYQFKDEVDNCLLVVLLVVCVVDVWLVFWFYVDVIVIYFVDLVVLFQMVVLVICGICGDVVEML